MTDIQPFRPIPSSFDEKLRHKTPDHPRDERTTEEPPEREPRVKPLRFSVFGRYPNLQEAYLHVLAMAEDGATDSEVRDWIWRNVQ